MSSRNGPKNMVKNSFFRVPKMDDADRFGVGDVMHFNILGKSLIVLSSQSATYDLLETRRSVYSSRPTFPVFQL